jgi:hypothetical protein
MLAHGPHPARHRRRDHVVPTLRLRRGNATLDRSADSQQTHPTLLRDRLKSSSPGTHKTITKRWITCWSSMPRLISSYGGAAIPRRVRALRRAKPQQLIAHIGLEVLLW